MIDCDERTVMAGSHFICGGCKSPCILLPTKRALSESEKAAEPELCSPGMWVFCRNTSAHLSLGSAHPKGEPWVIQHRSGSCFLQRAVQQKVKVSGRREFQLYWGKRHHDHFIELQMLTAIMLYSHPKCTILKKLHFQRLLHMPDKSLIHQLLHPTYREISM